MTFHSTSRPVFRAWSLAVCAVVLAGCASWQSPRIDPSGEHVLIWPGQATPVTPYGAPVSAPTVVQPALPPMGNVEAPPVYSNVAPQPSVPGGNVLSNPFTPTVVGPPVAVVPAGPSQPVAPIVAASSMPGLVGPPTTAVPFGQDHLRVTPERVLAPVGSEVVLKAGICTAGGFLLANQRVEWLLDRGGAGQFVDLNNRDELDLFRWPKNTPRKLDNWYAIGATSTSTLCLRRGTEDPNDDVQILRGEAWITVSSPTEGASHVTAYTPIVDDWQFRRATATIYWVDAQWVFPPSAMAEPGRPHVLTTTVTRRSDGAPVAGWLVRYEVAGGASLGYGGGNFIDVPTDAAGRASVEVSPTGVGGGSTTVSMTLIRPPLIGPEASPQLEIGAGSATITWVSVAAPAPSMPAPSLPGPATSAPLPGPAPSAPQSRPPANTYTPPSGQSPIGKADLSVAIRREGPEEVTVGDHVRFNIVVTNNGDGTARAIELLDKFDHGLSHAQARPNVFEVRNAGIRDLPPGGASAVLLDFEVVAAGRQCHEVTVTAEGGVRAVERACVTAREPQPVVQPSLSATMTGPTRRLVGEVAEFRMVINNTGDVPVTNIKIVDRYDQALQPTQASAGHAAISGGLEWDVDRLDVGERREFTVLCDCVMPSSSACNRVIITADGGVTTADEACVEILPQLPAETSGGATAPAAASNLQLSITAMPNPTHVRQRTRINVTVKNTGQQPVRQVMLRLMLPQEMTPVADQIQAPVASSVLGQEVRSAAMAELGPGKQQQFVIPVDISREGSVRIWARVDAEGVPSGVTVQSDVITIEPASF
jgi:uncharacterized repeat protein (TIGR01451 family)